LIDRVHQFISNQIQLFLDHIQHLNLYYQNLFAYNEKIEKMWRDNTLELKEREEQIVKESDAHIQQFNQLNYKSDIPRHLCLVNFEMQPIIHEFNQFGCVADKRLCHLATQVKTKTFESVTIVWKNTEQENHDDLISGDEFIIQYMPMEKQTNDETKGEKETTEQNTKSNAVDITKLLTNTNWSEEDKKLILQALQQSTQPKEKEKEKIVEKIIIISSQERSKKKMKWKIK